MRTTPRPRHYVSPAALMVLGPLFTLDLGREAYLLRLVGNRVGPVLRPDRRQLGAAVYRGPERRAQTQTSPRRVSGWIPLLAIAAALTIAGVVVVVLLVGGDGGTARGATQAQTQTRSETAAPAPTRSGAPPAKVLAAPAADGHASTRRHPAPARHPSTAPHRFTRSTHPGRARHRVRRSQRHPARVTHHRRVTTRHRSRHRR